MVQDHKWTQLVTNTDFLPTILPFYGITRPAGIDGQPIISSSSTGENSANSWRQLHRKWMSQSRMQSTLGGFPTIQTIAIAFVGISMWLWHRRKFENLKIIEFAATVPVVLPFALLLLPAPGIGNVFVGEFLTAMLVTAGALLFSRDRSRKYLLIYISMFLLILLADMFTGCHLLSHAWMSYSIMEGARYYGIGNEYAGSLFAITLCVVGALTKDVKPMAISLQTAIFSAVLMATGIPIFGAKAGSVLGMAVGFGVALIVWRRGSLKPKYLVFALVSACILLGSMLGLDLMLGGRTHIARAILNGGSLSNIAMRKLELNLYLLTHSVWSLALIAASIAFYLTYKASSIDTTDKQAYGTIIGLVAGAIALLLFNDAGVISAALTMLMATGMLAISVIHDKGLR